MFWVILYKVSPGWSGMWVKNLLYFSGYNKSMDGSSGLIFKDNYASILLVKRRDIPIWVLPGGGLEKEETPEQAVIREVFEETGFHVEIARKVGEYTYPKTNEVNHTYECVIQDGKKTLSNESKAIEYYQVGDLPEIVSPIMPVVLGDALKKDEEVVRKKLDKVPKYFWIKGLLHPWVLFKYLLTRIGIHWNT